MGQSESVLQDSFANSSKFFLTGEEAENALNEAEKQDGYLSTIAANSINKKARENNSYRVASESVIKSDAELPQTNIFPDGRIITLMSSADAGLPHTRGKDIICIPAYFPKDRLQAMIVHERVHLHQKLIREQYKQFYKKEWQFTENNYNIPDSIRSRIRLNPDTIGWPMYIWRDTWIPLCLFEREDKPSLRECTYCWYNPKGGVLLKSMPPAWKEFFGDIGQSEHPNELTACYATEYEKYKGVEAATAFYSFLFTKEHLYGKNSSIRE